MTNEDDWQTALATLADISGPLSHELQNFLNAIVLQAAIVGRAVPVAEKENVAVFRTLALRAADILGLVSAYRATLIPPRAAANVSRVVRQVATKLQALGATVRTRVARGLSPLQTCASDLSRLLWLIGKNAVASGARSIFLRVDEADARIRFSIEDDGPPVDNEQQMQLFAFESAARPGVNEVEMAACQGLARRLGAEIELKSEDTGVVVFVKVPTGEGMQPNA